MSMISNEAARRIVEKLNSPTPADEQRDLLRTLLDQSEASRVNGDHGVSLLLFKVAEYVERSCSTMAWAHRELSRVSNRPAFLRHPDFSQLLLALNHLVDKCGDEHVFYSQADRIEEMKLARFQDQVGC